MLQKEEIQKKIADYREEQRKVAENRDRMLQMADQQMMRIHQLAGAIDVLEKLIAEEKPKDVGTENPTPNPESKTTS
jgi:hypothetical protein